MASLDLYTQNIPLTQKAKFWTNFVSSLKGRSDIKISSYICTDLFPLKQRQPGSEGCTRGASEDLAPVCYRDSAQWLPRAQERVHQARVPDVRQTHEARTRAPHPGHCWRQREVSRQEKTNIPSCRHLISCPCNYPAFVSGSTPWATTITLYTLTYTAPTGPGAAGSPRRALADEIWKYFSRLIGMIANFSQLLSKYLHYLHPSLRSKKCELLKYQRLDQLIKIDIWIF